MSHRLLILKIKNPEKCGIENFNTHKKIFYSLAKQLDNDQSVISWRHLYKTGTFLSTVDKKEHDTVIDFIVQKKDRRIGIKFVTMTKNDKVLNEEIKILESYCAANNTEFKIVNELNYLDILNTSP